jgi:hypothetical protein
MESGKISEGATNFNDFSSNKYVNGTKEFLESNSLVAKIAFLFLVLIGFILALKLGVSILNWFFSYGSDPYMFNGMVDAKQLMVIPQDPSESEGRTIIRSINENEGIEFTWSVWMFIDDLQYNEGRYKHIFHKGNDNNLLSNSPSGINEPNNAPGLYLAPNSNTLVVIMNTFNNITEKVSIPNIPVNKWVCIQVRLQGRTMDVYINGKLTRRLIMNGVPKQNYDDVYVAMNGGFSGYLSNLRYYDYALGTTEINRIVTKGPNLQMVGDDLTKSKPYYLSLRWFFMGNRDGYNP